MTDDPSVVWRDQCNGRTLSCVNCGKELGGRHDVLCYAYAIERTKARRAAESGGSTPDWQRWAEDRLTGLHQSHAERACPCTDPEDCTCECWQHREARRFVDQARAGGS